MVQGSPAGTFAFGCGRAALLPLRGMIVRTYSRSRADFIPKMMPRLGAQLALFIVEGRRSSSLKFLDQPAGHRVTSPLLSSSCLNKQLLVNLVLGLTVKSTISSVHSQLVAALSRSDGQQSAGRLLVIRATSAKRRAQFDFITSNCHGGILLHLV